MQGILDRVLQTIRRHSLIPPSARVLVAVSGGSDSVALAHLLHRLSKTEEFKVSGIIHLHHGLRGEAADEDSKATRVLADDLQVPYHETRVDVRAMARERGNSIEEAGRAARIAFFEETAKRVGADRVAVGHTRMTRLKRFCYGFFVVPALEDFLQFIHATVSSFVHYLSCPSVRSGTSWTRKVSSFETTKLTMI